MSIKWSFETPKFPRPFTWKGFARWISPLWVEVTYK